MSATKFPRPVRNRSSSLRRTDSPNTFVVWAMISPLPGTHHFARGRDRVDDTLVPGAPADIPRDRGPDPVLGGTLDRSNLAAVGLDREHGARLDGAAVEEDGARAAMTRITTDMGARQPEIVPNEIDEQYARLDGTRELPAVHRDRDHVTPVLGANALALRTCLLSLRGHPNHLPARAVAVSSARRVNTSIIARLYSSLPRRSDVGCASPDAIFAASANAVGPAFLPTSAFSAPGARIGLGPTDARATRAPATFRFASRPSWTATPIVAKSPVFRLSFRYAPPSPAFDFGMRISVRSSDDRSAVVKGSLKNRSIGIVRAPFGPLAVSSALNAKSAVPQSEAGSA